MENTVENIDDWFNRQDRERAERKTKEAQISAQNNHVAPIVYLPRTSREWGIRWAEKTVEHLRQAAGCFYYSLRAFLVAALVPIEDHWLSQRVGFSAGIRRAKRMLGLGLACEKASIACGEERHSDAFIPDSLTERPS